MGTHPIENIMQTTMESIRNMVDVNTIVGDTVVMGDGTVIIPISKVCFGFVAGGGEYGGKDAGPAPSQGRQQDAAQGKPGDYPFAGGTGAGVSVSPMAFLVVSNGDVQLLPVQFNNAYERMLERVPEVLGEIKNLFTEGHSKNGGEGEQKEKADERPKHRWRREPYQQDSPIDPNERPSKDEL